ncbi:MAG: glutathione S-transferase [Massilia sp.]|nr:glutathione S-transferase [Massilia sp.]
MKLYFSPGACSLSPHIVLLEAGLPFTTEKVNIRKKLTAGGADYTAINPKGYVPALELDDGSVLTEGPAIVQYIADQAPDKQLVPAAGSAEHYQVLEWLNYIGTEIHKNYGPLFNPASPEDAKTAARAMLARRFAFVAERLATRDYLVGGGFSVADAYLFTVTNWAAVVQLDLSAFPALQAYQARIAARPAVQQAMRDEGLLG